MGVSYMVDKRERWDGSDNSIKFGGNRDRTGNGKLPRGTEERTSERKQEYC